jgi:chromosomal replication initiator protein
MKEPATKIMKVDEYIEKQKEIKLLRAELKKEITEELTPKIREELYQEVRHQITLEIESKYYLVPIKSDQINKDYLIDLTISEACKCFNVTVTEIKSKSRLENIVKARHTIGYVCKTISPTGVSLEYIGQKLGNKNHATILHGIRVCKNLMETDKLFLLSVESVLKVVNDNVKSL